MGKNNFKFRFFLMCLLVSFGAVSQLEEETQSLYIKTDKNSLYNRYDTIVGLESTNLYMGVLYTPKYAMQKENHAYFESFNFLDAYIVYDDLEYYNQMIKYDLVDGLVLWNTKGLSDNKGVIVLDENKISKFTLDSHTFVKISDTNLPITTTNGIFEILMENDSFSFFKAHKKNTVEVKKDYKILIKFRSTIKFMILYKGEYFLIKSKKDIINIFPEYKKELRSIKKDRVSLSSKQLLFSYILKRVKKRIDDQEYNRNSREND